MTANHERPETSSGSEPVDFGPYVVHERLGVGGMATVHRAKERGIEGFERIVALKRLLPHLAEDASFVKSFVREAKFASMLQHANIVQLYELGRVGSTYYISMEHIDGRDVRRILHQARRAAGPPNINVALSLLIQLCDALEYAHTRCDEHGVPLGLVHRDVSPSNLLVTRSGHLKVIDFGIAKAQSQQLLTQDGKVKGKLAYMAPEAVTGAAVDSRSDIFSVGVIAHELLTARTLFASKSEYQTLINVQRSDVAPPSSFNQAVPPELDAIVAKALARNPAERYQTAAQMRDDLHGVRTRYNLSATNREVETWCTWAFALDRAGSFGDPGATGSLTSMSRTHTPLPTGERMALNAKPPETTPDEDEAAAIAWGGSAGASPEIVHELPDLVSRSRSLSFTPAPSSASASIAAPPKGNAAVRALAIVGGLAVVGGGGFLLLGRGNKAVASNAAMTTTPAPEAALSSLKFIVEPADATIKIAGMPPHVGVPWKVDLDPGVVQIKVSRDGHQAWETSVELSKGEDKTIRVALAEAVGDPTLATLELGSQPVGLAIVLDGLDIGQMTPWKTQLPAGSHTVQLRDTSGAIAWKHTWNAEARTRYEFAPSMDAAKQQERVERERMAMREKPVRAAGTGAAGALDVSADPEVAPAEVAIAEPATVAVPAIQAPTPSSSPSPSPSPSPNPNPSPSPNPTPNPNPTSDVRAPKSVTVPAPPSPTAVARPVARPAVTVAPNAVKRTSGELPTLKAVVRPGMEVPKSLAAKICIDERGAVASVQVLKVTGELAQAFASSIRGWRYTAYREGGVATPACFVNSFALK